VRVSVTGYCVFFEDFGVLSRLTLLLGNANMTKNTNRFTLVFRSFTGLKVLSVGLVLAGNLYKVSWCSTVARMVPSLNWEGKPSHDSGK
jgi:hypothetical protein